jgi:tRNA 2-thiouridine synthesizing protein D
MATFTVVVTEAPYGREKAYSALRFALTCLVDGHRVNLFLMQDGVYVARKDQNPAEFPNFGGYLDEAIKEGADVKICTPCSQNRGLTDKDFLKGAKLATIHDLVEWTAKSDKVIVF